MPNRLITPSYIINNTPTLSPRQKKIAKNKYHFTDVNNAAEILNSGYVYSRNYACTKDLMVNDNAAGSVIEGTNESIHDHARFYFRPLTPTQYHNEGIRSRNEIHPVLKAHCPVPVFFLFNTDKVLLDPLIEFSYESLASYYYVQRYKFSESPKAFQNAPFHHIYHVGPYSRDESIIKKRRHAELIAKDKYPLDNLEYIFCRTDLEANTLANLLKPEIFSKYVDMIRVPNNLSDYYSNEYLSMKEVSFANKDLKLTWNKAKINNTHHFKFEIFSLDRKTLLSWGEDHNYQPYQHNMNVVWKTANDLKPYSAGLLEIYLDQHLMYKAMHRI